MAVEKKPGYEKTERLHECEQFFSDLFLLFVASTDVVVVVVDVDDAVVVVASAVVVVTTFHYSAIRRYHLSTL